VAVLAGSASTVLFAVSTLPMLIKASRTKELNSYSRGNLVLANVGNAVQSIYVLQSTRSRAPGSTPTGSTSTRHPANLPPAQTSTS
jgi:hypothetical protein